MSDLAVLQLEREVDAARRHLADLESQLAALRSTTTAATTTTTTTTTNTTTTTDPEPSAPSPSFISSAASLSCEDVERYSRQMLVDGIGAIGMSKVRRGRVLLVGAGGIGSTAALFLAAAGVGELRIVDFDEVERSNLHRQVIHTDKRVGSLKAESARDACLALNPRAVVVAVPVSLCAANAESLLRDCDVAVDASDNVAARYILCDAAARLRIPVVSGSALRWDAQLSVFSYNNPPNNSSPNNSSSNNSPTDAHAVRGPCYRCVFPVPPPPAAVGSCGDSGVVGPVPGAVGCLEALEAIKVLCGAGPAECLAGRMLLLDGKRGTARVVRLRGRRHDCEACGENAPPVAEAAVHRVEYAMTGGWCGGKCALPPQLCVAPQVAVQRVREGKGRAMLLDVRTTAQFEMARLQGAVSLPITLLRAWRDAGIIEEEWRKFAKAQQNGEATDVFVICRRGVTSTEAVDMLLPLQRAGELCFMNVDGGLNRYSRDVDPGFPFY